jgi:hypothetical protein
VTVNPYQCLGVTELTHSESLFLNQNGSLKPDRSASFGKY